MAQWQASNHLCTWSPTIRYCFCYVGHDVASTSECVGPVRPSRRFVNVRAVAPVRCGRSACRPPPRRLRSRSSGSTYRATGAEVGAPARRARPASSPAQSAAPETSARVGHGKTPNSARAATTTAAPARTAPLKGLLNTHALTLTDASGRLSMTAAARPRRSGTFQTTVAGLSAPRHWLSKLAWRQSPQR